VPVFATIGGLDLLGAAEGLKNQIIVVRINKIDEVKLKKAVDIQGGAKSAATSAALALVDRLPKAALDLALPPTVSYLKDNYGIDAEMVAADAPVPKGRSLSEFWPGVVAGGGAVGIGWFIWHYGLGRLLTRG
jgi:hypothetical protein